MSLGDRRGARRRYRAGKQLALRLGAEPPPTFRLKDFMASASPVLSEGWTEKRRHVVYFSAQDSETGWELWVTDGTPRGTRRVADIRPGPDSGIGGLTPRGSA